MIPSAKPPPPATTRRWSAASPLMPSAPSVARAVVALLAASARPKRFVYEIALGRTVPHGELLAAVLGASPDELRADPSPSDRWGGTPLDDAIRSKHKAVVDFLASLGAKGGNTATTKSRSCVLL